MSETIYAIADLEEACKTHDWTGKDDAKTKRLSDIFKNLWGQGLLEQAQVIIQKYKPRYGISGETAFKSSRSETYGT